ncbi:ABC-three component system protein [Vallitalea guaymasensis]|uniref:ABC-three component system protein n=1 Tax=Vallitalea guaymasensis TaxID=1185412 RepID=UPI0023542E14|nr:ABC-three component system protein [Vallitalea guaymasensis]
MTRGSYFNYIEEKLNILSLRINTRGKLNVLDIHLHSENFYMEFLNLLYGWKLENMNAFVHNVEGIDLIDHKNKLIVQVSATSTRQKIENTLAKSIFIQHKNYKFLFMSISNPADSLRKKSFKNPYGVIFNPLNDIYDIPKILKSIMNMKIDKQKQLYEFIKNELGNEVDIVKLDSDLAVIIRILSNESLCNVNQEININSFQIEKKIKYNELEIAAMIIDDYKVYYSHLQKKYKEFDKQGKNKSFAVLQAIRHQYIELCSKKKELTADILFLEIIENVKQLIINSKNYIEIPFEELDVCVNILVVDAFIRCKIFKNPEGYNYVIT